jgi:hypothetical protein
MDWHSPLLGPDIPVITCCRNPSAHVLPFLWKFPLEYRSTPKFSPCLIKHHTTRTYLVLGIPDLSTRCRCVLVHITLRPLFLRSSSQHLLDRRMGGLHNRPFDALETSSIHHCRCWKLNPPSPVITPLHLLRYPVPRQYKKMRKITPLIRTLVIRISNYPDRFGLSGKFAENSTKLTCLEITVLYCTWSDKDQVQYSVMASTALNQAWSKGSDAGTYCK